MQRILVIDSQQQPLMPCNPARARQLLTAGKAAVYRRYPFTIILKERTGGAVQPVAYKVDPGAKTTGLALVADFNRGKRVIWAAELTHRSGVIRDRLLSRRALRRGRRNRHTRYRPARFDNRRKPEGWLPPSVQSRVDNIMAWGAKLWRFTPLASLSLENVKFDTQQMENPEINGVEYQRGELAGYEVWEYLLEKWGHKCVYCGAENVPLEKEHIIPKSRGGSNRVSNLTVSCRPCNQRKNDQTAAEFGFPEVQKRAKLPLKAAAAVNAMRNALYWSLRNTGLPLETGTGGRTKFNRTTQKYPKAHWIDAACVGESGAAVFVDMQIIPLNVKAMGRGNRQMCQTDKYGFPRQYRANKKRAFGFQTGDMARAIIPSGKHKGTHIGRVTIRQTPSFTLNGKVSVHPKYLTMLYRNDGYGYEAARG